ncbi:hypothetical protein ACVQ79_12010 [Vibrio cholerae]|uniref:hypothetical protein n=1 Tax=Vibrio cholerae TaxID=666 RepID=UPI000A1ED601|nr:hypothetical protein [Vibrio cholerae]OSP45630.1 hypothetical protein B7937_16975 [Vibrio cholerae]
MMQVGIFNPVGGSSRKELDIGSVLLTTNTKTPRQMGYVGEWHLIEDGVTFISAETEAGSVMGTNTPVVPVPYHTHSARFIGNALPAHGHVLYRPRGDRIYNNGGNSESWWGASKNLAEYTNSVSAGTPSGTVTIEGAGQQVATLDVRGRHMKVFAWWRVG